MSTGWWIFIIVLLVAVAVLVALYFFGRRVQQRQEAQMDQMNQMAQTVSMLVIDKKKLRLKDAGLPQVVLDSAPRLSKLTKVPVVKAKVGPKVQTLLCDAEVFKVIPLKKECKVVVSGLYITEIKSARGGFDQPEKKKGLFRR